MRTNIHNLQIDQSLYLFINNEVLPGTGLKPDVFWEGFADIISSFSQRNVDLLQHRDQLQEQIDHWHRLNKEHDPDLYKTFLKEIGYLVDSQPPEQIYPKNVDPEVATLAGAQLVVPVMNARFALNAANARWVSLYDALYGTDVISEEGQTGQNQGVGYNPIRGAKVIEYGRDVLDAYWPLEDITHKEVNHYRVDNGQLVALSSGSSYRLQTPSQFVGFNGDPDQPSKLLLKHNGLHIELVINRDGAIGSTDKAGIDDMVIEAALTTIQDCEDSVAAVDAEDKIEVYRNWLGLMKGDLETGFKKDGKNYTRRLNEDRQYIGSDGASLTLPGRSLMFVRNVGHLMTNPAILDEQNQEVFEGILDAIFTSLIALHDLRKTEGLRNSRSGSIYIVKPKMHGPNEVQFTCDLFERIELLLGLSANTIKIGIMDEERRTTVNLNACINAAKERVVFINTGFLDRTGDEIHTSMLMGAMLRKAEIKEQPWINAYEKWNVDCGLEQGFNGNAQIGKGMWPMPDEMAKMMSTKQAHPNSGATTAWVPSPVAAALHALHYHAIDVSQKQTNIQSRQKAALDDILKVPLQTLPNMYSAEEIQEELDNNVQGILGYVVRWVDQGIGCSKVPDINNVGLMEDRATLRISSQHICNWLEHELCNETQVRETFSRMAKVVDEQNQGDPHYTNMSDDLSNNSAFQAACDLVFQGKEQPNGYTEPLLHAWRLKVKADRVLQNRPTQKTA